MHLPSAAARDKRERERTASSSAQAMRATEAGNVIQATVTVIANTDLYGKSVIITAIC